MRAARAPAGPDQVAPASVLTSDPPDLRLAGIAVATWLSALATLHLTVTRAAVLAVVAALLAAALAGHLLRAPRTPSPRPPGASSRPANVALRQIAPARYGWVGVAVLLGVVCGATATGARLVVRDAEVLRELAAERARVSVELVVRDDPRALRGPANRPAMFLLRAELVRLDRPDGSHLRAPARLLVLASDPHWQGLLPGQRLTATGRLQEPQGGDLTAAVLSTNAAPLTHGEPSWAQRAAGSLRAGLQRACAPLPPAQGGLLPGLVVGDTSRLTEEVEQDFRDTGMTHLNAVSGSNVALVVGLVLLLARRARAGPWVAAALCAVALVGFVILVRPSPSVVRAATMGAIGLAALALGRPRAALPALAAGITVLVVLDPALAADAGFALSVLATSGLLLLAPGWRDALRRRGVPAGLAEALVIPAAAQVACGPVVAAISANVSLVAVPANLLAVPAIAPATVLGVIAAALSAVWPPGAEFVAWLASWPAWWLVTVARYGAGIPAGTLPWPGGVLGGLLLAAVTVILLIGFRHRTFRRLALVVVLAVAAGAIPVRLLAPGWPASGWVVTACAVGQGDAIVLPVAPGRAVVVDAGPEAAAVDDCLRRLGVREVPLLVVSHFHADHVAGVDGVFRNRRVGTVLTPQWHEPAAGRAQVTEAASRARVPVAPVTPGWSWRDGSLTLELLNAAAPLRGTRSDPNNNSLVLAATVGAVRVLLTGDAESEQQRELLERLPADSLRADVLKVAHHGSAYQDLSFLDAVGPSVALVSAGVDNSYGHPSPVIVDRLRGLGVRVLRTDLDGDATVVQRPDGLAVVTRGAGRGRHGSRRRGG